MKKFLMILGCIFLVVIVLVGAGIAFVAIRGSALDKESREYADAVIPAIVDTWSEKALLDRASPEFRQAATNDQLDRLFRLFRTLGPPQKIDPAKGQASILENPSTGQRITAAYETQAAFAKARATIQLTLIKHGPAWEIMGFRVNSPAFIPN